MLHGLFSTSKIPKYDLRYCKLYDTRTDDTRTKMQLENGTSSYKFLKSVKHPNILRIHKITEKSIYTQHVVPFSEVFDRSKEEYNRYVVIKIKEALNFIHSELNREHNSLGMDALFVDDIGNVVIGKFENSSSYCDPTSDLQCLETLSKELTGSPPHWEKPAVVFEILESIDSFLNTSVAERQYTISEILSSKEYLIPRTLTHVISILIHELDCCKDPKYKKFILDSLFSMDRNILVTNFSKQLFSLLDSSVRLYLLKNIGSIPNVDSCIKEIALGLCVKDKTMMLETVNYIFSHKKEIKPSSLSYVLSAFGDIKDSEIIGFICQKLSGSLLDNFQEETDDTLCVPPCNKVLYKLLFHYLKLGKARTQVYVCVEQYFQFFDKIKLSTQLLPFLCAKLCDPEDQDRCFRLVDKILGFLRRNKSSIQNKEWSLRALKGMLVGKKETDDPVQKRIMKIEQGAVDAWEDEDVDE